MCEQNQRDGYLTKNVEKVLLKGRNLVKKKY
jgi:hypothetical protein